MHGRMPPSWASDEKTASAAPELGPFLCRGPANSYFGRRQQFSQHRPSLHFQMIAPLLLALDASQCPIGEVLLRNAVLYNMNRKLAA